MTLERLIKKLERCPEDSELYFDFGWFVPTTLHSWRGDYSQLGLGYDQTSNVASHPKVSELIAQLKSAIGETFEGWKGGEFVMNGSTPIWVENFGDGNHTSIKDVRELNWGTVIIETEYCKTQ